MSAYFDSQKVNEIEQYYLVIDTNVLTSCSSNESYFGNFLKIFNKNTFLIDPIVKLEFLRGTTGLLFEQKKKFLEFNKFYDMTDHQDIYRKTYTNAFEIAKIYSQFDNPNIPLGDLLIAARLMIYGENYLFLTLDKSDFSTVLFDRVTIISLEREVGNKNKPKNIIDHIMILKFNKEKYKDCLEKLKK